MRRLFLIGLVALISFPVWAQKSDALIFTYGKDSVFQSEFERVYSKNNDVKKNVPTDEEIQEYLELYVKFKLKVKEAYERQMDTNEAFINELAGYRKQLAQPYLVDNEVTEQLIEEAYNRMLEEVNASHILIKSSKDDSPADTLKAYKKIAGIRKELMQGKITFDSAAHKYSDDPSAKVNYGSLGYFSAFQMIYPFESMAFNTPKGEISEVFRTSFGYHILKVNDRRKSAGEIKVAHIMIRFNNDSEVAAAKDKIFAVYKQLKEGKSFDEMVKLYSEDYSNKSKGGEMNWFKSTGQLPVDFKEAAFALKNIGDYSEPVKTDFGWHIIKKLDQREIPSLEEQRDAIKYKVSRDERSRKSNSVVIERIKKSNNYKLQAKEPSKFISTLDTSLLRGAWVPKAKSKTETTLFTIADQKYTYSDFSDYISDVQTPKKSGNLEYIGNEYFNAFVEKMNFAYEEDHLEEKYLDFKYLMKEYRDGILLFELTDQMVWSKSVEDTTGLKAFYEQNKNKYMWGRRAEAAIFDCGSDKIAKSVKKMIKKNKPDSLIYKKVNSKDPLAVSITRDKFEKGKNVTIDNLEWKPQLTTIPMSEGKVKLVKIYQILEPSPKQLNDIMGVATSDYQSYLEDAWIKELKSKYPVSINQAGVDMLFK
ncbi:MAG: peptidylprolyl isomerase [Flavobacteriales bacterium]|nr:peptidylprolyl isomerase [Flavobacteriales bacterium]